MRALGEGAELGTASRRASRIEPSAGVVPWADRSGSHRAGRAGCLPQAFVRACRNHGVRLSRHILLVRVQSQRMEWLELAPGLQVVPRLALVGAGEVWLRRRYVISTSRFGIGQIKDTNRTPLGLHRIGSKAGGGWPIGVVLVNREPVGFTWQGCPDAAIAHRVLWLEGLEPGFNRGGDVDTLDRSIYVHGLGDERTLGRPASRGCIHLAAHDLMTLHDRVPVGTLVWITRR